MGGKGGEGKGREGKRTPERSPSSKFVTTPLVMVECTHRHSAKTVLPLEYCRRVSIRRPSAQHVCVFMITRRATQEQHVLFLISTRPMCGIYSLCGYARSCIFSVPIFIIIIMFVPRFPDPAHWSRFFQSRVFHTCSFNRPAFAILAFSVAPVAVLRGERDATTPRNLSGVPVSSVIQSEQL